jgi:hypothetical protein
MKIKRALNSHWREFMNVETKRFIEERNDLFRNPTNEAATEWWVNKGLPEPLHPSGPLATVHKARLQWLDATDDMIAQSMAWLLANGYATTCNGAPPLTPERRDAERARLGRPPLGTVM